MRLKYDFGSAKGFLNTFSVCPIVEVLEIKISVVYSLPYLCWKVLTTPKVIHRWMVLQKSSRNHPSINSALNRFFVSILVYTILTRRSQL